MMPSRSALAAAVALAAVSLAGCERDYVYRPTVATTSALNGRPASFYEVPPESPRGYVQLTTLGFADIQRAGSDEESRAIHLRMVVANNSDRPWLVDTREQQLALPNRGESRAAFARADQGSAPVVEIAPGGKRTIDLFYPLPRDMDDEEDIPSFDTIWKVQTDTRLVADRTPFERLEVEPTYAYGSAAYYSWGTAYWYDPFYYRSTFVGVYGGPSYYSQPPMIRSHPVAPPARQMAPPARQMAPPARR